MKAFLITASALVLGGTSLLLAQNQSTAASQVMGRGRGGAPYAWNDKNKDGICDLTGAPVGQGRGVCCGGGHARAMNGGWGRGRGYGVGSGRGRGMGRAYWMQQQQQQQPATPAQKQ
jgi:hypothetical protein